MLRYATMEITWSAWRPSWVSPEILTKGRAASRSMPLVKMRHAISCGMVVSESLSPSGSSVSCHACSPRARYQLPPHSPDMFDLNVSSGLCRNGAIGERQGPQKAIQNGIVEFAGHNAWFVHRQPDLLLVVPALREFACRVEPVRGLVFTCPADTERGLRMRIPGSVTLRE